MKNIFFAHCAALAFLFAACNSTPFDVNREGGYIYHLEADAPDFLLQASGYSQNPAFNQALQKTLATSTPRNGEFIRVFGEHYQVLQGSTGLSIIFATVDREHYDPKANLEQTIASLQKEYSQAKDRVMGILAQRLKKLGIAEGEMNIYPDKAGNIVLAVDGEYDQARVQHVLTATGQLGFYETYENDETARYIFDFEKAYVELYPDTSAILATGEDSVKQAELRKHPLTGILQFSLRRDDPRVEHMTISFEPGCRIGFANPLYKTRINDMLQSTLAQRIFPRNMHFIWGYKPEENPRGDQYMLPLYVVKAGNRMQPALDGSVINAAYADKDKQSGRMIVNISMNAEGAAKWEQITGQNKDRAIAMVFDGYVVSAPWVQAPIAGGNSVISGNFTADEAKEMALILESASLPMGIRIINKQQVKKKP